MENFIFSNPTQIIYGNNEHIKIGKYLKALSIFKVLLVYGGTSIKNNGIYDNVIKSFNDEGISFIEFSGIVANPILDKVYEGIKVVQENNIQFILAVGGGSVIDTVKAISAGASNKEGIWDLLLKREIPQYNIPYATILTLPATGSEMNHRSVITNEKTKQRRGGSFAYPTFSILDPIVCASLPPHQVANGIADMFSHLLERYFTTTNHVLVSDNLIEANMKTIKELALLVIQDPSNTDAYGQIMWAGTMAHNYQLCIGRTTDWASHAIEHEISGMYPNISHGEGMAIIFSAWMLYTYQEDINRFVRFAVEVMNVENDYFDLDLTARKGIKAFQNFMYSLGHSKSLSELGVKEEDLLILAANATNNDTMSLGQFKILKQDDVLKILQLAF